MGKEMYKLWVKFSEYTGNFEREFVAYMLGIENEYGDYTKYINEYEKAGRPLDEIGNILLYTAQEVDDWTEETFYNISGYLDATKAADAIFIQLDKEPTVKQVELFKKRTKEFCEFYNKTYEYGEKNIKAERITIEFVKQITNVKEEEIIM